MFNSSVFPFLIHLSSIPGQTIKLSPFSQELSFLYTSKTKLPLFCALQKSEQLEKSSKKSNLAMRIEQDTSNLISSDIKELIFAANKLVNHVIKLVSFGTGSTFLEWVASFAAIYLLILDRTNWRTNILTGLLIPYTFFSLPSLLFGLFRGDFGEWIAFIAVVLRLFFPRSFPECEWLEMPAALVLLIVAAPSFFAVTVRGSWIGVLICLFIACYLLQEHIRASGGFRNSFTRAHGVSNTLGIIVLFVYPAWTLVIDFL